ncbi:MAG: cytidine deaminase [Muribaculaceae bacterium]|jgi:cytidine deaminase|nr:cytidine deaminase [Muribaculaceae bacterium]
MKQRDIVITFEDLAYDELPADELALVEAAREATQRSYAPYSHFRVGAAIALDNGVTVPGSNQENVAFPSGTCAERSACFYAHARYPEARFEKIAVAARGTDGEFTAMPTAPCGACRQSLLEYEMLAGHDVPVLLAARDRVYRLPSVRSTLPFAFSEF